MKVQTNTTVRKILADELSRLIGEPYKYLGAPSMAFKIGPYTLNRDGSLEGDDFTAVRDFLIENNYRCDSCRMNQRRGLRSSKR